MDQKTIDKLENQIAAIQKTLTARETKLRAARLELYREKQLEKLNAEIEAIELSAK